MDANKKGHAMAAPNTSDSLNFTKKIRAAIQYARQRSRLPAYGKVWVEARRKGMIPDAGIFGALVLLDHWEIGPGWPHLVIPGDVEPGALDYRVLAGLEVTLAYRSQANCIARLLTAVQAINRDGAKVVTTLDRSIIYRSGHER